ncbi:unnamed protein product [Closterium sp. Naga37s-1]|nr:unnamed protein product [Closterium sp. Naga37s-1]
MSALVRVFNGYGERSSTNLTYWGLAGCADNRSMELYNAATLGMADLTTGTLIMLVEDADRPTVERITGRPILTLLGLPAPRKPLYIVNVLGSIEASDPIPPLTDFSASVPPATLASVLQGVPAASAPIFFGKHLVGIVMLIPIQRHSIPPGATAEQQRESVSTMWAGFNFLQEEMTSVLALLHNGTSPRYSLALYDTTNPGQPIQVLGPEPLRVESGSLYPYVLPGPVVPYPKHVELFPEDLLGRTYEAHCRYEGEYPKWELVYAPMLLGLLVLLVAVLVSTVIAVLAWKQGEMQEGVREMQLCTLALERAERSKSETVANTSHELRTPLIGMIGMIEELLESRLEEWQMADLRDARVCAGETVELINRVLDLAKLQAGRLRLETLPCCLRRIVRDATALAASDAHTKESHVMCHVDEGVPAVLMGDPTRLLQVIGELMAHAMGNTTGGHVTLHVACIPPPPPLPASINCFDLHGPSNSAAPVHALPASHASPPPSAPGGGSSAPGGGSSAAWHQLAACVRRFPPPTALACLPRIQAGRPGGGANSRGGEEHRWMGLVERCCGRVAAVTGMGAGSTGDYEGSGGKGGVEVQGGDGRLGEEVREWVEEACRAREEGEWMVVVACEDTGGGIPPEEMRWVLDPHGDSHHATHTSHALSADAAADGDGDGDDQNGQGVKGSLFPFSLMRRSSRAAFIAGLSHEQKAAARPRWTPYPVRFLLSTALVAEMRGDMAVLSHAATGTTILLALPLGGGEDADSCGDGEWDEEEGGGERDGCGSGSEGECVEYESGTKPGMLQQASVQQQEPNQQQQQQRASRTHSHLKPQASVSNALENAGEAKGELRAVAAAKEEEPIPAVVKGGRPTARSHSLPKPHLHTEGLGDAEAPAPAVASDRRTRQVHSLPRMHGAHVEGSDESEEAEVLVRAVVAGRSVAVVDDNAVNRMVARRTLQGYGAHVLLLPSGEDALQALSSAFSSPTPSSPPIHLLLLDLHMPPGIDGFGTASRIRAMERAQRSSSSSQTTHVMPEGDNTPSDAAAAAAAAAGTGTEAAAAASAVDAKTQHEPLCIIALTADLDAGVKRACLEAGMDGAVRKPIVAQELLAALIAAGFGAAAF